MTSVLSLTHMLVFLFLTVLTIPRLHYILACADDCLFCACLVSIQVSATICHSWQHTGVVHLSLQADGKVAFEDIPLFGYAAQPSCHNSSFYLFTLALFLEAVLLFQVCVAFNIFYPHIVHVYRPFRIVPVASVVTLVLVV